MGVGGRAEAGQVLSSHEMGRGNTWCSPSGSALTPAARSCCMWRLGRPAGLCQGQDPGQRQTAVVWVGLLPLVCCWLHCCCCWGEAWARLTPVYSVDTSANNATTPKPYRVSWTLGSGLPGTHLEGVALDRAVLAAAGGGMRLGIPNLRDTSAGAIAAKGPTMIGTLQAVLWVDAPLRQRCQPGGV
jgi:hypothetical protein